MPDIQEVSAIKSLTVAADIGGTFTDLVFLSSNGRLEKRKVQSTPQDYSKAIVDGVRKYLADSSHGGEEIKEIIHATTVATNAILERKGTRSALITTLGFRDVLELRRIRIPQSYNLGWAKPEPLVERALRYEVDERVLADGSVHRPLDETDLARVVESIRDQGISAVAVCCLHSYKNPDHEKRIGAALRAAIPDVFVSLSHEILPELREYERTSTTVVNSYVAPVVSAYLDNLRDMFQQIGVQAPILVMQSAGGLISSDTAGRKAVSIIESGPAAGVVAAAHVAALAAYKNVITFDMGGTTSKASIIENGEILRADEYEVGGEISVSSRLVRGGGYAIKFPVIDISEVGAGGGSIARVDEGGALRVGPQSAGSVPGPACYDTGNPHPTVTDANLVLGYLSPGALAGGSLRIDAGPARTAIAGKVGQQMGLDVTEAAWGIYRVANSNMVRAIKTVSVERGRNPADFVLMAFGGAGPLHAAAIAAELKIGTVIVPPSPGVFSSFGLLTGQVEQHGARSILCSMSPENAPLIEHTFTELRTEITKRLVAEGYDAKDVSIQAYADLRFQGQSTELNVLMPSSTDNSDGFLDQLEDAFTQEYQKTFGYLPANRACEFVTARVIATVEREVSQQLHWATAPVQHDGVSRQAWFGTDFGTLDCPVVGRQDLTAEPRPGPLLIQEYDTTIVVPPYCNVRLDRLDNVVITVSGKGGTIKGEHQ